MQARDELNNKRLSGGDVFRVDLTGASAMIHGQVCDNHDGTYTATYSTNHAGHYQLHITDGMAISCLNSWHHC